MKCLVVSDIHYNLKQYDWLVKVASDFDLVVIAGDLLDVGASASPQAQISVVLSYLKEINEITKLIVSSGNHDLNARNQTGEKYPKWFSSIKRNGIICDGGCFQVEGFLFTVYPWWDGPEAKDKITSQLENDFAKEKSEWIWVYHPPPNNSPVSWDGKKHFGDSDLIRWIEIYEPDMVLGGHVHQSPFNKDGSWVDKINSTWVFNPGRQIGPFPAHIIFELNLKEAVWFSLDGAEHMLLGNNNVSHPITPLEKLPDWLS